MPQPMILPPVVEVERNHASTEKVFSPTREVWVDTVLVLSVPL